MSFEDRDRLPVINSVRTDLWELKNDYRELEYRLDEVTKERDEFRDVLESVHNWMTGCLLSGSRKYIPVYSTVCDALKDAEDE